MIGSAQEKLQQRSDLEALVEQIEQETLEQTAEEVLRVWQAAVQMGQEVVAEGSEEFGNWKNKCGEAEEVLERVLGSEAEAVEVALFLVYWIPILYSSTCFGTVDCYLCYHARSVELKQTRCHVRR